MFNNIHKNRGKYRHVREKCKIKKDPNWTSKVENTMSEMKNTLDGVNI